MSELIRKYRFVAIFLIVLIVVPVVMLILYAILPLTELPQRVKTDISGMTIVDIAGQTTVVTLTDVNPFEDTRVTKLLTIASFVLVSGFFVAVAGVFLYRRRR